MKPSAYCYYQIIKLSFPCSSWCNNFSCNGVILSVLLSNNFTLRFSKIAPQLEGANTFRVILVIRTYL